MRKSEIAKEKFQCYNCCQSVLLSFSAELELSDEMAARISSGFGGGMGLGETCGAVTGAYMVFGLANELSQNMDDSKAKLKAMKNQFNTVFIEKYGSLLCKDLIGFNIIIPAEAEKASKSGVFKSVCPKLVSFSVEVIETII